MTKDEKEELINYVIYLDLAYMSKANALNVQGMMMMADLNLQYPKFRDSDYRRKLSKKLFDLIEKEGE